MTDMTSTPARTQARSLTYDQWMSAADEERTRMLRLLDALSADQWLAPDRLRRLGGARHRGAPRRCCRQHRHAPRARPPGVARPQARKGGRLGRPDEPGPG